MRYTNSTANTIYLLRGSRYVRLANTMLRVLRNARIPLFLCRKSNHIFIVWQHIVLLVIRQYQGKGYRMFSEWLVEAYYLRTFLQLSHVPHFTTLQKFSERITGTLLQKIISSFIILTKIGQLFIGIDSVSASTSVSNTPTTLLRNASLPLDDVLAIAPRHFMSEGISLPTLTAHSASLIYSFPSSGLRNPRPSDPSFFPLLLHYQIPRTYKKIKNYRRSRSRI